MKKNIISLLMVLFVSIAVSAENFKAPTKGSVLFTDTTTNHTYEIKEMKYPVFISKSGAFYIWKTSNKTNKKYKYYLPKDVQKQMGRKYNEQ